MSENYLWNNTALSLSEYPAHHVKVF